MKCSANYANLLQVVQTVFESNCRVLLYYVNSAALPQIVGNNFFALQYKMPIRILPFFEYKLSLIRSRPQLNAF